jgi:hypothetical protein
MAVVSSRWLPVRPTRLSSWLWAARELYYIVRGAMAGQLRVVARAKRDARRLAGDARPATAEQRSRIEDWLGRKRRPTAHFRVSSSE